MGLKQLKESKSMEIQQLYQMTPKEVYVSSIEIELPYTPKDVQALGGLKVEFVKYQVMKYLNRLTETIRFSTRRYWIKMISEKDIDIYDIEFEENSSRVCN